MPFVHTYVHQSTPARITQLIVTAIHQGLVSAIGMPEDELFNLIHPYDPAHFFYSRSFNQMQRSDQLIVVEITLRRGRSDAMKRALYAAITHNICAIDQRSPHDVFIFTHENDYSDWCVGNGQFAMALVQQPGSA